MWNEDEMKSATQMSVPELKKEVWRLKGLIDKKDETILVLRAQIKQYYDLSADIESVSKEDYAALKRAYDILTFKYTELINIRNICEVNEDNIVSQIARYYNFTEADLKRANRNQYVVKARNACYYVLYSNGMRLSKISEIFGKDHSSIIHGRNNFIGNLSTLSVGEHTFIKSLLP